MSVEETLEDYDESKIKEDNNELEVESQSQWSNLDQRITSEALCSWLVVQVDDKDVKGWEEKVAVKKAGGEAVFVWSSKF